MKCGARCRTTSVHRVLHVEAGDPGARHIAVLGARGDHPDASGLHQAHDEAGRAEVGEPVGVLQDVDHVLHGPGVGQGGRDDLDDVGLLAADLVEGGLLGAGADLVQFAGGVAHDADDPVRAPRGVAADVALGVRPAQRSVAQPDAEVGAVVLAAVLEGLRDQGVESVTLHRGHPRGQALGSAVVLLRAHVEDLVGRGVHVERTGVEVPVEGAHEVEGQDGVRVGEPVVRDVRVARSPINHGDTLTAFARLFEWRGRYRTGPRRAHYRR